MGLAPITIAIAVATVCAVLTESLVWYMIYRHEDYKKLCGDFEEAQGKLDSMKEKLMYTAGSQTANQQKAQERKLKIAEDSLKTVQGSIMVRKTRGMLMVGVFMMVSIGMLNSYLSGTVAAKLPFAPFGFMRNMTHYGI